MNPKLTQPFKTISFNPPQWIIVGFLFLIIVGSFLLAMPFSSIGNDSLPYIDALFMAVSAVCVVGLATIDVGTQLSTTGQIIIMSLVQLGGLGFMVFGVSVAIILGKVIGLKYRLLLQPSTKTFQTKGILRLTLTIFLMAITLEAIAVIVLTLHWQDELGFSNALYYGIFHSITAFNNAGFSLFTDSMERFIGDPVVNITLSALFIIGGLGFMVLVDLYKQRSWRKLSLHSKVVLVTSASLLIGGFVFILGIEWLNPSTSELTLQERLLAAYFQSATPRSAGFNTFEISSMLVASQFFIIVLMFIGASSGGTGGGIKTNTFVVLLIATLNTFRSGDQVHIFKRRIVVETVMRALAVVISSLLWIIAVALLLSITEGLHDSYFMMILFETVSAFSTTGLSMGLTSELSTTGKIIVMITMFVGRLGPLTMAYALTYRQTKNRVKYPEETILIG
ncbi:TrkH family potassium uptake protein [Geomicrobium sediminis]|uniref:Trk system potassium uptake protein TrkH n=1 Tax=Geomicrobium sediminis TaxID=1347788 RepID=A0ABS2PDS4_9BACL|nr:trk system potassium uptake protein TrkH [Geomicrobium sediminis]